MIAIRDQCIGRKRKTPSQQPLANYGGEEAETSIRGAKKIVPARA
jgi:hypothetical protein